ncbi:MAG TPA: EAL domain-containing protein [Dehalococcoidia bacterium]|nr:EAL domain-containing protein [Dehalococcoidia bacterium]
MSAIGRDEEFRALVEQASDIIMTIGGDGVIHFASPATERILGYPADTLVGSQVLDLLEPSDRHTLIAALADLEPGNHLAMRLRAAHISGQWRTLDIRMTLTAAKKGQRAFVVTARDVTEEADLHDAIRARESHFRALLQNASDMIISLRPDFTVGYASPSVRTVIGYDPEELRGKPIAELLHPADVASLAEERKRELRPGETMTIEVRVRHALGAWRFIEAKLSSLPSSGDAGGDVLVINGRDITERKTYEDAITHHTFHDPLTNLPNRILLADRLQQAVARSERQGRAVAVLLLDLDRFKLVNDSLGEETGNALLMTVAERLVQVTPPDATVARAGGDEFAVVLGGLTSIGDAVNAAQQIREQLAKPVLLDGREVFVQLSIGIALSGGDGGEQRDLLRNAGIALHRAKANGRGRTEIFTANVDTEALHRLTLEGDLRHAVQRHELLLLFQPVMRLKSASPVGMEALLRWRHPEHGLVPPLDFIPLAEETGLIVDIGQWVLREACKQAHAWQQRFPDANPSVSVNVSAREFQDPYLVAKVRDVLRGAKLRPDSLILELTESSLLADVANATRTLDALKGLGVRIALDDFGTGYSSMSYLKKLPVDILKVDKTFIDGLGKDLRDTAIVRAIVEIARSLDLQVTAEGIEDAAQVTQLRILGCEFGQGYYFAKPLDQRQASAFQSGSRGLRAAS